MTFEEQKLAVCEKLPELIDTSRGLRWCHSVETINWPTEGLQVCKVLTVKEKMLARIEWSGDFWTVELWQGGDVVSKTQNKDLLTAWLETLCRIWWPERFKD